MTGQHRQDDPATIEGAPVIEAQNLIRVYGQGDAAVHALRGVSFVVGRGDYVAVMGASGSGKSTLMNLMGCLDVPTTGRYLLDGIDVASLSEAALTIVRNRKIGFVFQAFNLIPRMNALANVELPLTYYKGVSRQERRRRALAALDMVGLSDRLHHEPSELSGGQKQRVAIARALVTAPTLILADEPTGNLDTESSADLLRVFDDLNAAGRTIVMITHEHDVAARARRVLRMRDGLMVEEAAAVGVAW